MKITNDLKQKLHNAIKSLITREGIDVFLFGSKSNFNSLCRETVTQLKDKYPHIKRVYVRAEFPFIDEGYTAYLLEYYDSTYYPERVSGAGKAAYVMRNFEIIDKSRVCCVYYSQDYIPKETESICTAKGEGESGSELESVPKSVPESKPKSVPESVPENVPENVPKSELKSNPKNIPLTKPKSGTKIAYDYALQKKKRIINLACIE